MSMDSETLPMTFKLGSNSAWDLIQIGHVPESHLAFVSPEVIFSKTFSSVGLSSFSLSTYPFVLLPKKVATS
jgi:hypothetical protein